MGKFMQGAVSDLNQPLMIGFLDKKWINALYDRNDWLLLQPGRAE